MKARAVHTSSTLLRRRPDYGQEILGDIRAIPAQYRMTTDTWCVSPNRPAGR